MLADNIAMYSTAPVLFVANLHVWSFQLLVECGLVMTAVTDFWNLWFLLSNRRNDIDLEGGVQSSLAQFQVFRIVFSVWWALKVEFPPLRRH